MFLGHVGAAIAAKRIAPEVSLGTLFLGAQFLGIVWPVLLLTGIERVEIEPGLMAASPLDFTYYPISHSLATAAMLAMLLGGVHFLIRGNGVTAGVVGGLVLSHWFLDLPMHRPDLPLWPGSDVLLGGGLWNSVAATLAIELGLLGAGILVYARATRARDRVGRWAFVTLAVFVSLFFLGGIWGPPPSDWRALAFGGLALFLLVPWGHWIDRYRNVAAAGEHTWVTEPSAATARVAADSGGRADGRRHGASSQDFGIAMTAVRRCGRSRGEAAGRVAARR